MKAVVLVVVLASCVSWRSVDPSSLAMPSDSRRHSQRVLLVTPAEAFEMQLESVDEGMLRGDVVHAWTLSTPTAEGDTRPDEGPIDMAERLHWTPQHTIPEYVHVPISSVRHARTRTYWSDNTKAVVAVGTIAFIVLMVVMVESIGSIGDDWGEPQ